MVVDLQAMRDRKWQERFESVVEATRSTWEQYDHDSPERGAYVDGLADAITFLT